MSGFKVYKNNASAIALNDIGETLVGAAGTIVDLTHIEPTDVYHSIDLVNAVNNGDIFVLDARDDFNQENVIITNTGNGNVTDIADGPGPSATNFTFSVTQQGTAGLPEISQVTPTIAAALSGGEYFTFETPGPTAYYVWFTLDGVGADPAPGGTGIQVDLAGGDTAGMVTQKIKDAIGVAGAAATTNVPTLLTAAESLEAIDNHNDTHFGISGGRFGNLDDPNTSPTDEHLIRYDSTAGEFEMVAPSTVINDEQETIEDIVGAMGINGTDTTFTYTDNGAAAGTIEWSVNDVFLRNTGDTLDSGTLQIATNAAVQFNNNSSLTIPATMTAATIDTPAGGFANANDLINKGYVDALVQGIDWKESVRGATSSATGGTWNGTGGTGGTGIFTNVDLTSDAIFDGVPTAVGGFNVGDRILVKDETGNPERNGIYVVVTTGAAGSIERAADMDGNPGAEVSGGNTTFVENGTAHAKTIWSVIWDGQINLNVDPINWSQTGATTDILANEGLNTVANRINLDIGNLTKVQTTIDVADVLAFEDVAGSGAGDTTTTRITVANFISSRNIMVNPGTNGLIVNNGGTLTSVSIAVNGAGPLDGLNVANADGTAGNPTLGLDIQNLPARSTAVDTTDRVAVWRADGTNANEYYTVAEIAGAVSATNSYTTWTNTGNGTGPSIGPSSSADTIDFNGGDGIDIDTVSGTPDTITFTLSRSGLADTALNSNGSDTLIFFDADNANQPEYRSFQNAFSDINAPYGITSNGLIRKTAEASPDTWEVIAIVASTNEDLDGLDVTNGAIGDTGNIEIGLDITNMTASTVAGGDMTALDEFPVWNQDEGTGGANRKITGQQIADGVTNILNITSLTFSTFQAVNTPAEDQTLLSYEDTSRNLDPILSVESHNFVYSDNNLGDNSWVSIGDAVDTDSGYIMPFKGRIVGASVHCENVGGGNTFALDVVVSAADSTGAVATQIFSGLTGTNANDSDPSLDITFAAGQKLRVQADRTAGSGSMQDTVITLFVKWEA